MTYLKREQILPEAQLPDAEELIAQGRELARSVVVGTCPFLTTYKVASESEYKRRAVAEGRIMVHGQVGYRSLDKTKRAFSEIHEALERAGYRVDRYGICFDWFMGYPSAVRADMPRGTGLILNDPQDFVDLTHSAPVAPHFGDFVIGTPAALENTSAALAAGATSIGNIGQYFTFRLPRWHDDVTTTAETLKAIALCAAQSVEVLIHSNLDDGFAALFCDLACGLGAVLIERYIIDELIGGRVSHCYGHTYSEPLKRLAFQRALAKVTDTLGSMVYGNTTIFVESEIENYANLASYLLVDIVAQALQPTGHALNPVPVTEAVHIPEIQEIIDAHLFANRLIRRTEGFRELLDLEAAERVADELVIAGRRFKENVLQGLAQAGIDTSNPLEMLLTIRRVGARRLEELFGPGQYDENMVHGRRPVVKATTVAALETDGKELAACLDPSDRETIQGADLTACVACTDVHEYGKVLLEAVLRRLSVTVADGGVCAEPDAVAQRAKEAGAHFIAISTYNGIALKYLNGLRKEMERLALDVPVFIGGKLNQIREESGDSLPVDVTVDLRKLGAVVCHRIEDMLRELVETLGKDRP
jgi:methylmalonyl-CoA mutase cobalamin-binding subunit